MWIFEFSLVVCSTESLSLVFSLGYFGSMEDEYSWEGIRLGGSATLKSTCSSVGEMMGGDTNPDSRVN
jgi:hypothetical protein